MLLPFFMFAYRYIFKTFPGYCGYLASMASMAGGADAGYIFEEKFGITELKRDLDSMISKMDKKMVYRYILDFEPPHGICMLTFQGTPIDQ